MDRDAQSLSYRGRLQKKKKSLSVAQRPSTVSSSFVGAQKNEAQFVRLTTAVKSDIRGEGEKDFRRPTRHQE